MDIRDYLKNHRLLTDGAMGTYFDQFEQEDSICSEVANITNPDLVKKIHLEYIQSGANLIRSNTFMANRAVLSKVKSKREDFSNITLRQFVQAGYLLASDVAKMAENEKHPVFAAASIGPLVENGDVDRDELLEQYYEICDYLLEAGCSTFVMETFPDEYYVLNMADHIRQKNPDAWILGQFSIMMTGYSSTGLHVNTILTRAIESGKLDAVGLNCGIGANHMEQIFHKFLERHPFNDNVKLAALPNCGYPQIVRGKAVYSDSVPYFSDKMKEISRKGVSVLGGCCGTSPSYIKAISTWIHDENIVVPVKIHATADKKRENRHNIVTNPFYDKIVRGEKVFAVELDPPFEHDCSKLLNSARQLIGTKADIITIADSPLARSRADSLLISTKVKRETGMQVMPHLSCRDRNRISLRGGILGAYINDIRNCLIVTGDPVSRADRDNTKSVFDFNSIKFMRYVKNMNEGMFADDPLIYGGALNQDGLNTESIGKRMMKKMEEGCSYFLTQPVYSDKSVEHLKVLKDMTEARIVIGIMPLISYRNAIFMKNEMPGIYVPEEAVSLYREDGDREEWEKVAIDYSLKMMKKCDDIGAGFYMMTPFNRVHLIKQIMEYFVQIS